MYVLHTVFTNILLLGFLFFLPIQPNGQVDQQVDTTEAKEFDLCSTENIAFLGGEEVVYKIYYNWNFVWLSAGEVTFKVEDQGSTYKLSAKGRTYSSYEWFFKVRDYYEAIVDKQTLQPIHTIRDVKEGNYSLHEEVSYSPTTHAVTSRRKRGKHPLEVRQFDLSGCAHDILSSIYYTRNQNFNDRKSGFIFPVRVFLDREEYPLKVAFDGKVHQLDVRGQGLFKALSFTPQTIPGHVFEEGNEMKIYASDDSNHIPLLIESPVSVGSVKAVLKSYKGLRYPVTSRINE
ncbi:MAG: DUF3108 domain-containing protein [Saprospiraceae bacterium]|nr:DUF3108 domain-containing protein [Saprospiraceae bacterium]